MRWFLFAALFIFSIPAAIYAQVRGRPDPTPISPSDQAVRQANDISRRSNELRNVENFPVKDDTDRKVFREQIRPLYREPSDEEMAVLAPDPGLSVQYAEFLSQKNSGLITLISDKGCADNQNVVVASADCMQYTMPGGGSAYSFRERMHRLTRLADLSFAKNSLRALGTLTHGIMVNLGDVPIENVTLESEGANFIVKFKPASDMKTAAEIANKLIKGIRDKNLIYGSVLSAQPNTTYILRSIAYRGEALKSIGGIVYNELELDKREDIIVAFRVVEMVPGKSITMLWKELRDKKSPRIKAE